MTTMGTKITGLIEEITLASMKEEYLRFGQVINLIGVMVVILGVLQDYNEL
jgi:hypothetical protein